MALWDSRGSEQPFTDAHCREASPSLPRSPAQLGTSLGQVRRGLGPGPKTTSLDPQSKWSVRKPQFFYELALEVTNYHFCHILLVTQATLVHGKKLHKGVNTKSQGSLGTLFNVVYNSDKQDRKSVV